MSFTIGSLFDGSGGFPLAATMCGGTPKWASEIEPYPIAVTKSRFPNVKHLGSVTDIKGGEVEPVDVITFGSPCQDLSVAGKRAGLKHEANGDDETTRSGLFMEAVRIIKEMREATNGVYPRFALWENVPGAFSSNKGEDFRIVLEELVKIAEPSAVMPEVPKNGWPYADSYCGDGWSLAYRVLDAQFWGVPQRRRRIYLVADFRGECAGKVSFEREGLRGYFETGRTPWQTAPGDAESGSGATDCERKCYGIDHAITTGGNCTAQGPCVYEDIQATLKASGVHAVAYSFDSLASNSMKSSNPHSGCRQVEVSKCLDTTDPNPSKNQGGIAIVDAVGFDGYNSTDTGDKSSTLGVNCGMSTGRNGVVVYTRGYGGNVTLDGVSPTLEARAGTGGNNQPIVAYGISSYHSNAMKSDNPHSGIYVADTARTLDAMNCGYPGCNQGGIAIVESAYCLQGNMIGRADKNGPQGGGVNENTSFTLNTTDKHAVAFQTYQKVTGPLMANSHPGSYTGQDAFSDMLVAGVDARNATEYPELTGALQVDAAHNLNSNNVVRIQYIVRRLTPTECARLQGFPDTWGHPDAKTKLTDEEYQFWLNVRNTHAAINDKPAKDYTKDQILKWYNGLHTDSSEYKMWGNGIALPNALYMMQGIADVMTEEKAARRKWLNDLLGDCL